MTKTFAIASSDVVSEEFDGEYVVLDVGTGRYFSLASGSALVWQALVEGHSVEALCARLPQASAARTPIDDLAASLVEHGLLITAPREAEAGVEALSSAVAADGLTFELDVFNDLADLLVADPVHDVDEGAGWPYRPKD